MKRRLLALAALAWLAWIARPAVELGRGHGSTRRLGDYEYDSLELRFPQIGARLDWWRIP